jgi:ubiquitin carboxyl-terminal hydrolase 4/11
MGGAADLPQRSSSPLKRRASDLEASDVHSSQKDDVDMISVPPSGPPDSVETTTQSFRNRAVSIDMLKDEGDPGPVDGPLEEQSRSATPPKAADTGMLLLSQKMLLCTLTICSRNTSH